MANARIGSALPFAGTGANYIETIDTDGKQLIAADSGKTFFCVQNDTADVTCNLPKLSESIAGWNVRFLLSGTGSNAFQIMPYGSVAGGGSTEDDDKMMLNRGAGPIFGSAAVDLASLGDGDTATPFDITVTGADLDDLAICSPNIDAQNLIVYANVRAANTVEVIVHNETGGTIDLASTTWKVAVFSGNHVISDIDSVKFASWSPKLAVIDMCTDGTYWYAICPAGSGAEGFSTVDG